MVGLLSGIGNEETRNNIYILTFRYMEHIKEVSFLFLIGMLGFELIIGLIIAFFYANLFEDWKTFARDKRIFTATVTEWKRLQEAIKIKIEKERKYKNVIEI